MYEKQRNSSGGGSTKLSDIATECSATLSDLTRNATNVARDPVPAESDGELDAREFNGKTDSFSPGDKADWRLKTPSNICCTKTSADEIYLLAKILESLGSMFCLNKRDQ